jgi:hypothetical protein
VGCSPRTATFVGCPTFRARPRCEHDQDEPTKPVSDLRQASPQRPSYAFAAVVAAGALAATALLNRHLAKKAEQANPPAGRFLEVDGVRLHYVERGSGDPLVLLHGNGSMIQDFESSGLVNMAAKNYRVIVIDRPGFGHSSRPRNVIWTPDAQAQLIRRALDRLVFHRPSYSGTPGASVAVALALKFPDFVRGLVLASGQRVNRYGARRFHR